MAELEGYYSTVDTVIEELKKVPPKTKIFVATDEGNQTIFNIFDNGEDIIIF